MANYKSFIYAGHGTSRDGSYDSGCVNGKVQEHDLATQIRDKVVEYLAPLKYSLQVGEQNYKDNITNGNTYGLKWGISIHINSGGGTGSECLVPLTEKDFNIENDILAGLKTLGLVSRGIKSRDYDSEAWYQRSNGVKLSGKDYFGEIRNAMSQGTSLTILEVGFIDNAKDLSIIQNNIDKIAFIIASAIAKYDGKVLSQPSTPKPPVSPPSASSGNTFYRTVCGSFLSKENAEIRKRELEMLGYKDVFIDSFKK